MRDYRQLGYWGVLVNVVVLGVSSITPADFGPTLCGSFSNVTPMTMIKSPLVTN